MGNTIHHAILVTSADAAALAAAHAYAEQLGEGMPESLADDERCAQLITYLELTVADARWR